MGACQMRNLAHSGLAQMRLRTIEVFHQTVADGGATIGAALQERLRGQSMRCGAQLAGKFWLVKETLDAIDVGEPCLIIVRQCDELLCQRTQAAEKILLIVGRCALRMT